LKYLYEPLWKNHWVLWKNCGKPCVYKEILRIPVEKGGVLGKNGAKWGIIIYIPILICG